jgi:hypothetical protein
MEKWKTILSIFGAAITSITTAKTDLGNENQFQMY